MAAKNLDNRVFVGGLSWEVTERQLEDGFRRFGKVIDCEIMVERDTGRPRGFGFLTFSDRRAVEDAIREMHDREFGGRVISVNRAEPRPAENPPNVYGGGYSSGARGGGYRGGNDRTPRLDDECFKCGRPGHWARDCPTGGGSGRAGDPVFSSRSRYLDDRPVARGSDRFGDRDRYIDDRYDTGRFADRDRFDTRDRYPIRDRFAADRYPVGGDRYAGGGDRYRGGGGGFDRYPADVYEKDRPFERDVGLRRGSDRYGAGGPARSAGRNFGERAVPYERPPRGGRPSSYERY